jgi:hypothetical protein
MVRDHLRRLALVGGEGLSLLRRYGLVVVIDEAGVIAVNSLIVPIVANESGGRGGQSGNTRGG